MLPLKRESSRLVIIISCTAALALVFATVCFAQSFRITSIQTTNKDVRITWNAPGGSNYVVQTTAPLGKSNFVDVGPIMAVTGGGVISTNFTHQNALLNSTSRFYRVRSYPIPPTLSIYPTNAVIGMNMTNRYSVRLVYPDNSSQDVTLSSTLTVSNNIGQFTGFSGGYALVRGTNFGSGSVRAVYQGLTNTVGLNVALMTGLFTVPPLSSINDYVAGQSTSVQVMGIFAGKTNNVTPASNLDGGAASSTRIDYNVFADVANSYALITGQSAANGGINFTAGGVSSTNINVTWCKYPSVSLSPQSSTIKVGDYQDYSAYGNVADGSYSNLNLIDINSFSSFNGNVALWSNNTFRVYGVSAGTTLVGIYVNNGAGCSAPSYFAQINVIDPPVITSSPSDLTVPPGGTATFSVSNDGASPFYYQWQLFGTNLPSATNNPLVLNNVSLSNQGDYRVIVTNIYGRATSSVATLTVVADGSIFWINRYSGPGTFDIASDIKVDTNGNVFVTGNSKDIAGVDDFATVKYSSLGAPLWTNRYNGPSNGYDFVGGMAVDIGGNAIVIGSSDGVSGTVMIKYSGGGAPLWTNRYNGSAYNIAVDSSSNIFVAGTIGSDYGTVKYSGAGTPLWTNIYNGPNNNSDTPSAIAVDNSGNVFVTGSSTVGAGNTDIATVKYSNSGSRVWTNRYNGPGNGNDSPNAIAVDSSGNAIVTGYTTLGDSSLDFVTIKYSGAGVPLWTNRYNGPGNSNDTASAVGVDSVGNVFVAGTALAVNELRDYATIKYSAAGIPLWTNRYNGPANDADQMITLVVDNPGNVFVTGYSWNGLDFDYATIKYSSAGALQWIGRYNGPGNDWDIATGMVVDNSGNVVMTGYSPDINDHFNFTTIKYCSSPSASNNNFVNRIPLTGSSIITNADSDCASKEAAEPNHANNIGGKSVWWSWTAPASGTVTIATCGSDFDTTLGVYTGNAVNALIPVTNNDDFCGLQSQVQFVASSGTNYQIAVDGYKYVGEPLPRSGNINLSIQQ